MAEALADAFERARRALEGGHVAEAATTIALAAQACARAEEAGLRLEPRVLESLRELHARCLASLVTLRSHLARELATAGSARRATSAYHR